MTTKPGPKPLTGRSRTSAERQAERMARLRAAVKERDRYFELYGPLPEAETPPND